MAVFRYGDMLVEVMIASSLEEESLIVECWDITVDVGRGLLFTLVERDGETILRPVIGDIPVGLIARVLEVSDSR